MVRYMTVDGDSYSPNEQGVIQIKGQRYSVRGFVPQNVIVRNMNDGTLPMIGGQRLYDSSGKLSPKVEKDAKAGSTLVALLIDEATSKLTAPSNDTVILKGLKRIIQ